ncbi:MAG: ABC transporter ATP-binding protein [Rickettsiales bacterium]|nr:ABC transporter ATP-binding protein [Rickettsiales bacterium]
MLKINNLEKSFGGIIATDNVTLELQKQTINAVIGPNGAGKTTLFNLITGKLKPDSGKVFVENKEITNLNETETTQMGIARAFQITNIFPNLTVYESIKLAILSKHNGLNNMWTRFKDHNVNYEADKIMELAGLTKSKNIISSELSHGDQKLLDIALALCLKPKLLLLDEPTAGMGPEERWKMIDRIKELWKKTKITILFIEHDMDIVFGIAQKIYVLQQGAILAEGQPKDIKKDQKVIKAYLGGGKK